jgi:hypothetical protein
MMRGVNQVLLASLAVSVTGGVVAAGAPAEPPGLREAVAAHINAQAEVSRTRWHANIEDVDPKSLSFKFGISDLSGEKHQDAVVLFTGQHDCGSGGCTLEIYRDVGNGFRFVSATTLARAPVRVTSARDRNGWKSLIISTRYWGDVVLGFNGRKFPLLSAAHHRATSEQVQSSTPIISE